jgi:phage terminase large subunit-like protein
MNVEYQAIAAEAKGAHGGSPIVAILDEVGQVRGPYDAFIEAIETSQGAYAGKSLLIAISTQAPSPNDLFSRWLDDARLSNDPHIVSHVYQAPEECDLLDREAWAAANPALGIFRSLQDVAEAAERATRMPTAESTFRWLYLNQRVEASTPFVSRSTWAACGAEVQSMASGTFNRHSGCPATHCMQRQERIACRMTSGTTKAICWLRRARALITSTLPSICAACLTSTMCARWRSTAGA